MSAFGHQLALQAALPFIEIRLCEVPCQVGKCSLYNKQVQKHVFFLHEVDTCVCADLRTQSVKNPFTFPKLSLLLLNFTDDFCELKCIMLFFKQAFLEGFSHS